MSKAASYRNYSKAVPTQSDDAITATLASDELNQIVGFAQMSDLLLFTTGAYYRLAGGRTASRPKLEGGVKLQANVGAAAIRPIVVRNAALFVTDKAQGVHGTYDYQSDTYQPDELSLTAAPARGPAGGRVVLPAHALADRLARPRRRAAAEPHLHARAAGHGLGAGTTRAGRSRACAA
jgi:hypothetical protein